MCETFTIKELQIVEYSISTLINEGMKHYNVSFLIQALGELIECNSLTYLDYQPLLERPMLKSKELELVDWEKLYSAVQDSFKNTTFPFIINYLISNPRCLLNTICHLPLNTMVNSSISLPSNLYDVTFIGLNKKYDFLQIPENEPYVIPSSFFIRSIISFTILGGSSINNPLPSIRIGLKSCFNRFNRSLFFI